MAVYVSNITIEQGFDFDTSFQLEDTRSNEFLNLVGAATTAMLRKHSAAKNKVSFISKVADPDTGIISISLSAANTVSLKPGRYVYDVQIITSGGRKYKAIEGNALVRSGVTR